MEEAQEEVPREQAPKRDERNFVRRYQFRNIKDLRFDDFSMGPVPPTKQPSVLPYFIQNGRYRATAVLEESVIDTEVIKHTAFLRQFDPEFVDQVLGCEGCVRAIVFLPNQVIVHEGEKGDSMMVIAKGEVEVSVKGVPVKRLGEGSFFGELVFVGATDLRTATISAVTFCDVRVIYRSAFTSVIHRFPAVEAVFNQLISQRMESVQKDMVKQMQKAIGRSSMRESHGRPGDSSNRGSISRQTSVVRQLRQSAKRMTMNSAFGAPGDTDTRESLQGPDSIIDPPWKDQSAWRRITVDNDAMVKPLRQSPRRLPSLRAQPS